MLLEYTKDNELAGRIDGKMAQLNNEKWLMTDILHTKNNKKPIFYPSYEYSAFIDEDDIKNSLSAPEMMSFFQLSTFIYILEKLGYSANDYKIYYYNILLMPIVIVGFVFLASSMIIGVKQNDKFTSIIINSLLMIFIYYFFSNLMNAIGSNSKLPPLLSTSITPFTLFIISLLLNKYKSINKKI